MASDRPFKIGGRYVVLKDFTALRDTFRAGEILEYDSSVWSRYDGITGYLFRTGDGQGPHVWDLYDHEPEETWRQFFKEIPG